MENLKRRTIHINQLLHGYDEGHRLLAGSIKLDPQSAKTLLALSDLSGRAMVLGPNGYITGYPVPKMSSYALARTWLAPEISRPGCVWTHTLLIDFSDLAIIGNIGLLDLFLRPSSREYNISYGQVLTVEPSTSCIHPPLPLSTMIALLEAVYEFPKDRIFVKTQKDLPADHIAVALWLQQWPRLRRNFRFCTWALADRSRSEEPFDLQFSPEKRNIQSRNRGGYVGHWIDIPVSSKSPKEWTLDGANDAISGDNDSSLRKFLWRYGAETEAGRAAFKPLVRLWQALESDSQVDIVAAITQVDEIRPAVHSLSLRVMHEVLKISEKMIFLPIIAIDFIFRTLPIFDTERAEDEVEKVAEVIWRNAPERVLTLFGAKSTGERSVAAAAAELMQPDEALRAADGDAELFCAALKANPKLAASTLVWEARPPLPKWTADILATRGIPDPATLQAMLEADNQDLPQIGIDAFGQAMVNAAVEYYDRKKGYRCFGVRPWLLAAEKYPQSLLTSVAQNTIQNIETLAFIATLVSYKYPPVSDSRDEWVSALASVHGDLGHRAFGFYAFLLARALSGVSPEPGKLICSSFDLVHNALMNSQSDNEGWSILKWELPDVTWWESWDKAYRVRKGVVKAFVDYKFPPHEFLEVTKDEYVFKKLVDIAASSLNGIAYLESVSSWARNSFIKDSNRLANVVEMAINRSANVLD